MTVRIEELLHKLIEIERAVGIEEPFKIRQMVMQAQEHLLAIQKGFTEQLKEQRLAPATVTVIAARDYRRVR